MPTLEPLHRHLRLVAVLAILVSASTWAVDLAGLVYNCPFCRAQRTVIGLLGLLMLVPDPRHWLVRWLAATFAAFGLVVGITQNFSHWRRINAGEFQLAEAWWVDPFLLSGAAIFIISGLVLLLWSWRPGAGAAGRA
ncbi:MAG: hypothetical protein GX805_11840 [Gammaproteobacteria bacterium]|nr:hypothetical protein [Gammaproteobacteria bacterium]